MSYQKAELLYEGKAKKIYSLKDQPDHVWVDFKNSLTAFNALKKGEFENKGSINRDISSLIFKFLKAAGVDSHWVADPGPDAMIVKKLAIIPLEVVVRNWLAGSTAKKLGIEEGKKLKAPLVEFYFKDDALADPFMSDDQILMMEIVTEADLKILKTKALEVNRALLGMWQKAGIQLIDFKIEFGRDKSGNIILADEISPDCCRLWDIETQEKLDKDRFRRDLGNIKSSYEEVLKRLQNLKP